MMTCRVADNRKLFMKDVSDLRNFPNEDLFLEGVKKLEDKWKAREPEVRPNLETPNPQP